MQRAAGGPIDAVLDLLPPEAPALAARAAILAIRPHGRVVLMGGFGMLGGEDLAPPYSWIMRNLVTIQGQWMYEPVAVRRLAALVHSGLLALDQYAVTAFPLDRAMEDAVAHAAANPEGLKVTAITL